MQWEEKKGVSDFDASLFFLCVWSFCNWTSASVPAAGLLVSGVPENEVGMDSPGLELSGARHGDEKARRMCFPKFGRL